MNFLRQLIGHRQHRRGSADPVISPSTRVTRNHEGAVWLHLERGLVFRSNHIGALIWQGLADRKAPESIANEISTNYGVPYSQVASDIAGFLKDLAAQGLIVEGGAA